MRLFAAIDLPDHVKKRIARVVHELSASRADVRWIHAKSMHLTLKFLGDVDARDVGAVDATINRVAGAAQPTRGRLRDLGSFPHLRRPRVLWIGVQPDGGSLAALHDSLQSELAAIGFPREARGFRPHVTIGRVRGNRRLSELRRAVEKRHDVDAGAFSVDAVTLFESELRRDGAHYRVVGVHPLGESNPA